MNPDQEPVAKWRQWLYQLESVSLSQKIFFVQQLGIMVRTGISLAVALKTLAEQTSSKKFRRALLDIQAEVEKGNLLSRGLEKYPKIFSNLFINMVKAGETSGKLEDVLKQLYVQMKKDHDIIAKVRGAMIYPAIVITMMIIIGIVMMIYVIPNITGIFKELNVTLPLTTRILIAVSDFSLNHGLWLALGIIILIIAFGIILRSKSGRYYFHLILLHLPVVGKIIKKINIARFCRTMSSLLKTDIPIIQSFEITARILGNVLYREVLAEAKEKVKKGVSINGALLPHPQFFPPVVLQMIAVGEETGSLDEILEESAIFYEDDVAQTMTNLPTILEPVLVVILGIGVGGMAVAVISPLYALSEAL